MELTTNEKKTIATAIKVAQRLGADTRVIDRIKDVSDKLRQSSGEKRVDILSDFKTFNRRKSLKSVLNGLESLETKYIDEDIPVASSTPREQVKSEEPTAPESQKKLRGRKVIPTVEEEEKEAGKEPQELEPEPKQEEPEPKEPQELEPEPPKQEEQPIVEPEPKAEMKVEKAEEPIKRTVEKVQDDLVIDPNINPPSKQMGKSLDDLTVEEINKDLDYFYKNYANRLKKLKRVKSNNLEVLKRFYRRVLAKLRVEKTEEDKKVGVVIKGSDFIKNTLKEIILENSIDGLSASDLLINIEGKENTQKSDAGAYQFKEGSTSGKIYAQQEPIARLIPTTEEQNVAKMNPRQPRKIYKLGNPKTEYRGLQTTAREMVVKNPFLNANQPTIKLKKIY